MKELKCPDCGARNFYVKDPEDRFSIDEFHLKSGKVEYLHEVLENEHIPVYEDTEIFCDSCAWHDQFKCLL